MGSRRCSLSSVFKKNYQEEFLGLFSLGGGVLCFAQLYSVQGYFCLFFFDYCFCFIGFLHGIYVANILCVEIWNNKYDMHIYNVIYVYTICVYIHKHHIYIIFIYFIYIPVTHTYVISHSCNNIFSIKLSFNPFTSLFRRSLTLPDGFNDGWPPIFTALALDFNLPVKNSPCCPSYS